jgi:hypothetical protein
MLRIPGEAIGIPSRLAADVIGEQVAAANIWIGELDQLPFDANSVSIHGVSEGHADVAWCLNL